MVDEISGSRNIINFTEHLERRARKTSSTSEEDNSTNSSNTQELEQIAQDIFARMTKAAEALAKKYNFTDFRKLEQEANSLLKMTLAPEDKMLIFNHLELLSEKQKQSLIQTQTPDSQEANLYVSNRLQVLKINLEINSWDNTSLQALHKAPLNTGHPAWSDQLFGILNKTTVPESGRIMIYDNLAGLYDHHLGMFKIHAKQEPDWDIIQTASFVLDIADEEFRQEKEYDEKEELIKANQPKMRQAEIKTNDLKPSSLDDFPQKRLEKEYNTDSEITLRTDFKNDFLRWIHDNLEDFCDEGFNAYPQEIFNELCASAKTYQALRLSRE